MSRERVLSTLPNPPPDSDVVARLRHRLRAEMSLRRAAEHENLRLRIGLAALQRRTAKRLIGDVPHSPRD